MTHPDDTQTREAATRGEPGRNAAPEKGATARGALFLFIGTYSGDHSRGIYVYEMDPATGRLTFASAAPSSNSSYVCVHPGQKWVYAVGEQAPGTVSAFSFDPRQKKLSPLNTVSSQGNDPCHLSVDRAGQYVLLANYASGTLALFPIAGDGSLKEAACVIRHHGKGIDASRQAGPHPHMIAQEGRSGVVYVSDLGIDAITPYRIDAGNDTLVSAGPPARLAPGSGPRHFVGHATLSCLYVLTELKGTLEAFHIDPENGALNHFQSISNMERGDARYPGSADIQITPDGRYLFATNRGDVNAIGMYRIDRHSGRLASNGFAASKGKGPRNFAISPSGQFLAVANQDTGSVAVFEISPADGRLIERPIEIAVPRAACVKYLLYRGG
jgi:6-phosphogluconolactonase